MRKKKLLQIKHKGLSDDIIRQAREDRYIDRPVKRQMWTYRDGIEFYEDYYEKIRSYATRLYFTAQKEDGILVICVYTRDQVAAGTGPLIMTFIDIENEKWLSKIGEKWSEAYLSTMLWNLNSDNCLKKTAWGVAKDVFSTEDLNLCNKELCTVDGSITDSVKAWQEYVRGKENRVKLQKRIARWNAHMALIPPLPEGFEEWADKDGTGQSNFLFYRKKGRQTEVYCSHCGKTWKTDKKLIHAKGRPGDCNYKPEKYFCMCCGEYLAAKAWGKQKYLRTDDNVVIAQKAGEYIAFRKFFVVKRFQREEPPIDRWNCETVIRETFRVLANPYTFGSVASYEERTVEPIGSYMWAETFGGGNWNGYYSRSTEPYSIGRGILYLKNIGEVLENTGVRRVVADMFLSRREENMQYALEMAARKGYIEYLIKAGMKRLAREAAYSTTKFDGKNAKDLKTLLGVNGQQLHTLKKLNGDGYMIDALKYIEKHNEKIDDDTLQFITSNKVVVKDLPMKRTGMTLQRMVNYLRKQSSMEKMSFAGTNNLYKDYLKMAADRGMDLTDEIVCHTAKLRKMHDRYLEEKNAKEAEAERTRVNRMFPGIKRAFLANTEHFAYTKGGLTVFAPKEASDIKREGRLQHHCVGATDRYMKSMDEGKTFILFLRRTEEPETPYYTLEVEYGGKIRQSYGAYDRKPDWENVEPILKAFSKKIQKRTEKENKQKARDRILVPAM